jgi:hypothetical protein
MQCVYIPAVYFCNRKVSGVIFSSQSWCTACHPLLQNQVTQTNGCRRPTNPPGIKAGGEGGTTAAPAVMVSAILDAFGELGVRDIAMPATPFTVWTAIQKAKAQ